MPQHSIARTRGHTCSNTRLGCAASVAYSDGRDYHSNGKSGIPLQRATASSVGGPKHKDNAAMFQPNLQLGQLNLGLVETPEGLTLACQRALRPRVFAVRLPSGRSCTSRLSRLLDQAAGFQVSSAATALGRRSWRSGSPTLLPPAQGPRAGKRHHKPPYKFLDPFSISNAYSRTIETPASSS
jgi:hypothetical protein